MNNPHNLIWGVVMTFWEGFLEENFDTGDYDIQRLQSTEETAGVVCTQLTEKVTYRLVAAGLSSSFTVKAGLCLFLSLCSAVLTQPAGEATPPPPVADPLRAESADVTVEEAVGRDFLFCC